MAERKRATREEYQRRLKVITGLAHLPPVEIAELAGLTESHIRSMMKSNNIKIVRKNQARAEDREFEVTEIRKASALAVASAQVTLDRCRVIRQRLSACATAAQQHAVAKEFGMSLERARRLSACLVS